MYSVLSYLLFYYIFSLDGYSPDDDGHEGGEDGEGYDGQQAGEKAVHEPVAGGQRDPASRGRDGGYIF